MFAELGKRASAWKTGWWAVRIRSRWEAKSAVFWSYKTSCNSKTRWTRSIILVLGESADFGVLWLRFSLLFVHPSLRYDERRNGRPQIWLAGWEAVQALICKFYMYQSSQRIGCLGTWQKYIQIVWLSINTTFSRNTVLSTNPIKSRNTILSTNPIKSRNTILSNIKIL